MCFLSGSTHRRTKTTFDLFLFLFWMNNLINFWSSDQAETLIINRKLPRKYIIVPSPVCISWICYDRILSCLDSYRHGSERRSKQRKLNKTYRPTSYHDLRRSIVKFIICNETCTLYKRQLMRKICHKSSTNWIHPIHLLISDPCW